MPDNIDFFHYLESELEPVFDAKSYSQISPELLKILETNKLFKDAYLTEIECDKCAECPENNTLDIKHDKLIDKYYYTCPTGYLKNPVLLSPDDVKGWQFDFNRLDELIRINSNLRLSGENIHYTNAIAVREIGWMHIVDKKILVVYCHDLTSLNCEKHLRFVHKTVNAKVIITITPNFKVTTTDEAKVLEDSNIYLITLESAIKTDFNLSGIIKEKLADKKPIGEVMVKFPTPEGSNWDNVTIEFISKDEVKISMQGLQHPYAKHFSAMGFQDDRRTLRGVESDMSWRVFRLIAQNQGEWTLGILLKDTKALCKKKGFDLAKAELSPAAQKEEYLKQFTGMRIEGITVSSIPKYVESLRRELKKYFGLTEDPFYPYYARGKKPGYKTKFRVFCSYNESMDISDTPTDSASESEADENSLS